MSTTYDAITKTAQEVISPYLTDKSKLISIAKTLQDSHYKLLTNHADLVHTIKATTDKIQEKREQAQTLLTKYDEHKGQLADMVDIAVGKLPATIVQEDGTTKKIQCSATDIQCMMGKVNTLATHIKGANEKIKGLLKDAEMKATALQETIDTKTQNTILSQLIQSQIQTIAK